MTEHTSHTQRVTSDTDTDYRYSVLLYYCYTQIDDPPTFLETHHRYCLQHALRGRIIVAAEGINGTLSGLREDCQRYIQDLKADPRFGRTHFKVLAHHKHAFQKLHVRIKPEIVRADLPHIHPLRKTGQYLTPQAFRQMKDNDSVLLLDVRSQHEHTIGKFAGALTLDINYFREFPSQVAKLSAYKDRAIITYCTGGVRCEKASAYLLAQGFQHVYQLEGGIIQYGLETDGRDFEGTCYVFDNRVTMPINRYNPTVISTCYVCQTTCDRMINCADPICNRHVTMCSDCAESLAGACSTACQQQPTKRPYVSTGYYTKNMQGYDPHHRLRHQRTSLSKAVHR